MPRVPARCTQCSLVFTPNAINIAHGTITLRNNGTRCPHCGGIAYFVEGTLETDGDYFVPISAPPLTHAVLDQIKRITEAARARSATADELIEEIEPLSPKMAAALRPLKKQKSTAFLAAIIIYLIAHIHMNMNMNVDVDVKLDVNQLVAEAVKAIESGEVEPSRQASLGDPPLSVSKDCKAPMPSEPSNKILQRKRRQRQLQRHARKKQKQHSRRK